MTVVDRLQQIRKFFAEFWNQLTFESKVTFTTFVGLTIALRIILPFHIDDRVLAGAVFGTLLAVMVVAYRISIRDHQKRR